MRVDVQCFPCFSGDDRYDSIDVEERNPFRAKLIEHKSSFISRCLGSKHDIQVEYTYEADPIPFTPVAFSEEIVFWQVFFRDP